MRFPKKPSDTPSLTAPFSKLSCTVCRWAQGPYQILQTHLYESGYGCQAQLLFLEKDISMDIEACLREGY